jgi:threonine dehydrogenase-like Zn-dependent dehydrogenase
VLAEIPFGLHAIDDARLVPPDRVVTKPILSGICGSDAKLVLGDIDTGDIDNPMAAFSSLLHVPGHEVGRGGCLGSGAHGARRQAPTPLYPGR